MYILYICVCVCVCVFVCVLLKTKSKIETRNLFRIKNIFLLFRRSFVNANLKFQLTRKSIKNRAKEKISIKKYLQTKRTLGKNKM